MKYFLTVILTCFSLMANDVEHLYMYLLFTFNFFAYSDSLSIFKFGYILLIVKCKSSLYILDTNLLPNKEFANIFPILPFSFHLLDDILDTTKV